MAAIDGARGDRGRSRRIGGTAVVVGASMGGLCAARALSDRFDAVVVLDRDELSDSPDPRRHVPQGRHPHLLLTAGARELERWFPGIDDELRAAGAIDVDVCRDFLWHQAGGYLRRPESQVRGPAMSRPLLERTVRRRVEALPGATITAGAPVAGLLTDESGARVVGVRLADGGSVAAALVIDATGRQPRSLAWLEDLGYDPPPTSLVAVDTRYVTRVFRRTGGALRDWKGAGVIGAPASKRLAMALPMEGDRWIVCIAGVNGESAPTDPDGMLAYARTLESPVIADLMATAEPLGDPVTHRFPANQRRHVERLARFPLGWALLGDAVCSFDPIYGQGMTSAALQARALGEALDRAGAVDRSFARSYFRAVGRVVKTPWSTAVGGDFVYDGTTGAKPFGTDVLNRYFDRLMRAGQHDDEVVTRVNEVLALVRRPESLMTPGFALRVLRAARRPPAIVPPASQASVRVPASKSSSSVDVPAASR